MPLDILFIGSIVPDSSEYRNVALNHSGNLAQTGIVEGLSDCDVTIEILSLRPEPSFPKPKSKLFFYKQNDFLKDIKICFLGFINLPVLKNLSFSFLVIVHTLIRAIKKKRSDKHIMVYNPYIPNILLVYVLGKLTNSKVTAILYDVGVDSSWQNKIPFLRFFSKVNNFLLKKIIPRIAGRIIITKDVGDVYAKNKNNLLIDGGISKSVENRLFDLKKTPRREIRLLLAGTLNTINGVDLVLQISKKISNPRIKFLFAGKGPKVNEIIAASKDDKRISYVGSLSLDNLFLLYEQTDYLLNLRILSQDKIFVFPSKFIEYMAVGRPIITTNTAHLKEKYADYAIVLEKNFDNSLIEILNSIDDNILLNHHTIGVNARSFALQHKTWSVQSIEIYNYLLQI